MPRAPKLARLWQMANFVNVTVQAQSFFLHVIHVNLHVIPDKDLAVSYQIRIWGLGCWGLVGAGWFEVGTEGAEKKSHLGTRFGSILSTKSMIWKLQNPDFSRVLKNDM